MGDSLAEGIEERGFKIGFRIGLKIAKAMIAYELYKDVCNAEEIARFSKISIDKAEEWVKKFDDAEASCAGDIEQIMSEIEQKETVYEFFKAGYDIEKIARLTKMSVEEIEPWIEEFSETGQK